MIHTNHIEVKVARVRWEVILHYPPHDHLCLNIIRHCKCTPPLQSPLPPFDTLNCRKSTVPSGACLHMHLTSKYIARVLMSEFNSMHAAVPIIVMNH